jgi:thiol-disulfide isomerase/thioredoxin
MYRLWGNKPGPAGWFVAGILAMGFLLGAAFPVFGQSPPANDDFANAAVITGTNAVVVCTNTYATKEPGEPDHACSPGGKSVWWRWQAPANGYVTISTAGSVSSEFGGPMDTVLGVYIGNSVSNLVEVASNDDGPVAGTSEVSFQTDAGNLYRIAVDGFAGSTNDVADSGIIRMSLEFSPTAPEAPAWGPLPSISGGSLSSSHFAGKVVVLNFWATTCGGCVTEIPELVKLQNAYATAGLAVVGISDDASPHGNDPPQDLVWSFVEANNINYPVVMSNPDGSGVVDAYGVPFLPKTFIIDRQNHIMQTLSGGQSFATFSAAVLPLLYGPQPLGLTITNGTLRFTWPIKGLTHQLEKTDQPAGGVWTAVQGTPFWNGSQWVLNVMAQPGTQFFRLHRQ